MKIILTESQCKRIIEGYVNLPIDDDISLELWEDDTKLELTSIVIPKDMRGQGKGTEIINMVCKYADDVNKPVYLTPDISFGATSVNRLKRFYKNFGFKKNRDYEVSHSLVRYPISQ
jgi:predicted GNAT family N-acyltransferase